MKMKPVLIAVVASILLFTAGHFDVEAEEAALQVGDPAPAWVNPTIDGEYVFSKNYYGESLVLLDFYATWCVNCNEKLPDIESLHDTYAHKGLAVLLFAIDKEGTEVVEPFFRQNPTNVPVLIDRYRVTLRKKFKESSVPVYYLIGTEGTIVYRGRDVAALREMIAERLSGSDVSAE